MTQQERYDLLLEIFGDGTLTNQEARARVYGNVVIDSISEYGINRWFTEKGLFRENCAKFLGLPGPYPAKLSAGYKGTLELVDDEYILPDVNRLQDFIMPSNEWCYPALIAELEYLNGRKFWMEQAQKLIKPFKISEIVAAPLEQVDLALLKTLISNISHDPRNTREFSKKISNGLEIFQYLFNHLIIRTVTITGEGESKNTDIDYSPSEEANTLANVVPTLKEHKLADPEEHTPTRKQLARVKASLKSNKEKYYINNTPIPSLLALEFYKTFKIFPNFSIVRSWLEESS